MDSGQRGLSSFWGMRIGTCAGLICNPIKNVIVSYDRTMMHSVLILCWCALTMKVMAWHWFRKNGFQDNGINKWNWCCSIQRSDNWIFYTDREYIAVQEKAAHLGHTWLLHHWCDHQHMLGQSLPCWQFCIRPPAHPADDANWAIDWHHGEATVNLNCCIPLCKQNQSNVILALRMW